MNKSLAFNKDGLFICHERGTKENSESPRGIEPMASQIPVGALTTELRDTVGELGH